MNNKKTQTIAIITAGGIGSRMKLDIPKQFFEVYGKPIIFYTLAAFQNSKDIDRICLVYLKGYEEYFRNLVKEAGFTKVNIFVEGGDTNELSIRNGLLSLKDVANEDDIVIVHDGIRPLVDEQIIKDNIKVCKENGNAVTVVPSNEAMLYSENKNSSSEYLTREFVWRTQTPHSMRYKDMMDLVNLTISKGITNSVAICTMLIENNKKVYFSKGNHFNFKITYPEDIDLLKAILDVKKGKNEN